MKKILIIIIALIISTSLFFWLNNKLNPKVRVDVTKTPIIIGYSLGTTHEERWFTDRDYFVRKASELGATVNVTLSDNDYATQITQINNLVSQGVKVIVVIPSDSEKIAPAIKNARDNGVKIIAYDRLIKGTDIDFYISFDNIKVGKLQAKSILNVKNSGNFAYIGGSASDNNAYLVKEGSMSILNPLIDSGQINLVVDQFMDGWKSDEAYKTIKNYLATGKKLDAIVTANDGMAFGVIQALKDKGLDAKIPVSGQDADLAACQRIIEGTQTSTVYKPIVLLADKAAEIAVAMTKGEIPEINSKINNGNRDILAFLLDPIIVDKNNMMATIVKDGFHTYDEIYKANVVK